MEIVHELLKNKTIDAAHQIKITSVPLYLTEIYRVESST